jgi:hypothetical protein
MRFPVRYCRFLAISLLLLPLAALADDIQINGTCVVGTCPPPSGTSDALQYGQSTGPTSGSYLLTFGDGDKYSISWTFEAYYDDSGTEIIVDPVATYAGSSPSVGNDLINFDAFQNFYAGGPGNWDGDYTETIPLALTGSVGAGSTVAAQLFWSGQGLGEVGPYGPGYYNAQNTVDLTGLDANTLTAEYEFAFDFTAGTLNGASAFSGVPEPSSVQLLILMLAGTAVVCGLAARRRSGYTK